MCKYFFSIRTSILFLIFCCTISFHSEAQNNKISVQVFKVKISINEPFLVSFEIKNKTDSFLRQKFPGFLILKGPKYMFGQSIKDRFTHLEIKGYTTDTNYYSSLKYLLIPVKSGKLLLHGAVFYFNNKELSSTDTIIEVSDSAIQSSDSIKIINELWPDTYIDKELREKVDSAKIDVTIISLTSDFKEKKVKLNETFTITYKLNYLLFNKICIELPDFEIIKPPTINFVSDEVQAHKESENHESIEIYTNWVCVIKPKKKGKHIIKPAVIYIKGQPIKSNEIKIIVK